MSPVSLNTLVATPKQINSAPSNAPGTANVNSTDSVSSSPNAQTFTPTAPTRRFADLSPALQEKARTLAQKVAGIKEKLDTHSGQLKKYENQLKLMQTRLDNIKNKKIKATQEEIVQTQEIIDHCNKKISEHRNGYNMYSSMFQKAVTDFKRTMGFDYTEAL